MNIDCIIPKNVLQILKTNQGIGRKKLAELANISISKARTYVAIWKNLEKKTAIEKNEEPYFFDKKIKENVDWREIFRNLETTQIIHKKLSTSQDEATIKLTKKSIILFSADWHLGSVATDYKEFQYNIEKLLETDNCYLITVGDLIDNFRKFYSLEAIFSQIATPKMQKEILQSLYDELTKKRKWLAGCWGDHDVMWDEKIFGQSPVKELLAKKIVYFNGKGVLHLLVGEQKYEIVLSHKLLGNSIYNPNHPQNRESKWYHPEADLIVSAHKHNPAVQNIYQYGRRKCFIQVGTFKIDDGYSKRFWEEGIIGVPAVTFDNKRHEVFAYPSLGAYLDK